MKVVVQPEPKTETAQTSDGIYSATLSGVRQFQNAYGTRIGFEFTLENGTKVMRSTAPNLTPKSKLADVLRGLLGRDLTDEELGQGMDLSALEGTDCRVLVSQGRSRSGKVYSNVEKVFQ